jgi:hypothetical protein
MSPLFRICYRGAVKRYTHFINAPAKMEQVNQQKKAENS